MDIIVNLLLSFLSIWGNYSAIGNNSYQRSGLISAFSQATLISDGKISFVSYIESLKIAIGNLGDSYANVKMLTEFDLIFISIGTLIIYIIIITLVILLFKWIFKLIFKLFRLN